MFTFRPWKEKDFGNTDGWCRHEGGEGLIYPAEFWESNESFRRRLEQFPQGCWACANDRDEVVGYMFGHPWVSRSVVPLDCRDLVIPHDADCYYLHDIAVIPKYRGMGIGKKFLALAVEIAKEHGFGQIRGVAVLDSLPYWQKLGFVAIEAIDYGKGQKGTVVCKTIYDRRNGMSEEYWHDDTVIAVEKESHSDLLDMFEKEVVRQDRLLYGIGIGSFRSMYKLCCMRDEILRRMNAVP